MENKKLSDHECEVCKEKATCACQDIGRIDNFISGLVEKKPYGPTHFFCDKHCRPSIEYDMSPSPIEQYNNYYNKKRNKPSNPSILFIPS
jgi:hypothetical protein